MLRLVLVILLAGFASAATAVPDRDVRVWFSPNVESEDYRALMDADWNADRQVQIFKFHSGNLNETDFAPNTFPEFKARNGFNNLRSFGLELAIETGVMKAPGDGNPDWCTGKIWKDAAVKYVDKVERELKDGGKVRWLHLDGLLIQTKLQCQVTRAAALATTLDFAKFVKQRKPDVGFIDIEPYPALSTDELKSWVNDLQAAGSTIEGLHLDINRETGLDLRSDAERQKLLDLARFVTDRGWRFGLIYWGQRTSSNYDYVQDVLNFYVDTAFLRPYLADLVFQNWHPSPGGKMDIPINLPDRSAPVESHLGLLRSALSYTRTVERGEGCGRDISSLEYRAYYPDIRMAGADPTAHSEAFGRREGRCSLARPAIAYREIHRFFRPDAGHLITTSFEEGKRAGLTSEGVAFRLIAQEGVANTRVLYRCLAGQRRFASTDAGCEGQRAEGALGRIYTARVPGTRPLFRLRNGAGDYLVTTVQNEGSGSGYKPDGTLGYVP